MTLAFAPERIEQWPLARLQPYAKNAKVHGADQVAKIAASMAEFGWTVPCLVAEDGGTTFLQAKTANEVLKAQERRLRLQKMKGELIDRARATALVFRLAREGDAPRLRPIAFAATSGFVRIG